MAHFADTTYAHKFLPNVVAVVNVATQDHVCFNRYNVKGPKPKILSDYGLRSQWHWSAERFDKFFSAIPVSAGTVI